jgi:hypothetical protein
MEAIKEVCNIALREQVVMDTAPEAGELVKSRTDMVVDKLK